MALTHADLNSIKHLFDDRFELIDKQFVAIRTDIDNLAIATAQQFEVIDQRFDAMDQRFDAMDRRLDAMDQRFDAMDRRFEAIDQRFDRIDQRFGSVDDDLADIKSVTSDQGYRITRLERKAV